jgi:DNA-binding NarL/FixJ family response regulator
VLDLLLAGVGTKHIARQLALSPVTVAHIRSELLRAHQVETVAERLSAIHRAKYDALEQQTNARPNRRSGKDRRRPER